MPIGKACRKVHRRPWVQPQPCCSYWLAAEAGGMGVGTVVVVSGAGLGDVVVGWGKSAGRRSQPATASSTAVNAMVSRAALNASFMVVCP